VHDVAGNTRYFWDYWNQNWDKININYSTIKELASLNLHLLFYIYCNQEASYSFKTYFIFFFPFWSYWQKENNENNKKGETCVLKAIKQNNKKERKKYFFTITKVSKKHSERQQDNNLIKNIEGENIKIA